VKYNSIGKQDTVTDARGNPTQYSYDVLGRLVTVLYADQTKDTITYDNNGNRTSLRSHGTVLTDYSYDGLNRVNDIFFDNGHTKTTFDAVGRVKTTQDPLQHVTTYGYDDAGRRTSVTDALLNPTTFEYDEAGNQTKMTDALQHVTKFVYDDAGRRTTTIYHDLSTDSVAYDELGRQISKTDQAGKVTQFGYDALGRLKSVTQSPDGGVTQLVTSYAYDELGNRISQTDANSHTTTFAYDQMGRRTSRTLPVGMSESYTYDNGGNLATRTDFNGRTTTYQYDNMNRLQSKTADAFFSTGACAGGNCGATQISFTYTATGKRNTMIDATGTTGYGYDGGDRMTFKGTPFGSIGPIYDLAGNLTQLNAPLSNSYTYDILNRLSTVSTSFVPTVTYTYDAVGNLATQKTDSIYTTTYTYDTLNRLTNMQTACGTSAPSCGTTGRVFSNYTYALGAAGNRLSVSELGGRTVTYGYDDLYRLTSETIASDPRGNNGQVSYTYDNVGNRTQRNSTLGAVPATGLLNYDANDRTSTDPYDPNGNLLASGGNTNIYDFENRLVQAGGVRIVYDGDGNRVQETVAGVTTRYLVSEINPTGYVQVMAELTSTNQLIRGYMWGLQLLAQRDFTNPNTFQGIREYAMDGHGSVRALIDTNGVVTDTYDYDAFGTLISRTGTTFNNYLFAGEQFDPALGIYYNRARYYDQRVGRFWTMDDFDGTSADPISLHKYLYAGASPVDHRDTSGNEIEGFSIANAINITLSALNAISFVGNVRVGLQSSLSAYSYFQDDDPWNGTMAIANAVLHLGMAALSAYGMKTSLNLPRPPTAFATAAGNLGVQALWLNPQFVSWTFELLWPVVVGTGGIYFATAGHTAEWELRESNGRIKTRGTAQSGDTGSANPTWAEQNASHTEMKILKELEGKTQPGMIVTMRGELPPCRGTCSPAMVAFAKKHMVTINYAVGEDVWIFRPSGQVTRPY
jgi:RHS repeat-associated protein